MALADVVSTLRREGRTLLTEVESKEFIKVSGIPVAEARLARSKEEAASLAKGMGFPVALKILSPDIIHKSDVGGVKLGLNSQAQVRRAHDEVLAAAKSSNPAARIHGVSVQRMAPPGVEVILGMAKDPQFGPVVMFGLGGILVEVLKDVSFRLVPLTPLDARRMIREIHAFPVLQGYRGRDPADIGALEQALLKLSRFVEEHPEAKEIDLNPVFAYPHGVLAVDARVVLESKEA